MANLSNDETMWALPQIQCPSCKCVIDTSNNQVQKLSKEQRKALRNQSSYSTASTVGSSRQWDEDMEPDDAPEITFVVVSCGNHFCKQYNRFKVLRIPKISTPSVKVSLE